jgi:hypothetical protein
MEQHPIHTIIVHCKYHPDDSKGNLKKLKDLMIELGFHDPRVYQLNELDYQFWFGYSESSLENYRAQAGKFQELLKSFAGNVAITSCGGYGDNGKDVTSAILQDWNSNFLAKELQVQRSQWRSSVHHPGSVIYLKWRVRLSPEGGRALWQKFVNIEESIDCYDSRVFQLNAQDWVTLSSFPYANVGDFQAASGALMKFMQDNAEVLELLDCQPFGNFPSEILDFGLRAWKPSVLAPELK